MPRFLLVCLHRHLFKFGVITELEWRWGDSNPPPSTFRLCWLCCKDCWAAEHELSESWTALLKRSKFSTTWAVCFQCDSGVSISAVSASEVSVEGATCWWTIDSSKLQLLCAHLLAECLLHWAYCLICHEWEPPTPSTPIISIQEANLHNWLCKTQWWLSDTAWRLSNC